MDAYRDRSPVREQHYPAYLAAATAGRIADSMWLGIVLLVLARTPDVSLAGAIVAGGALPTLVSAPLIGAWLDLTAHRRAAIAVNEVLVIGSLAVLLAVVGHAPAGGFLGPARGPR